MRKIYQIVARHSVVNPAKKKKKKKEHYPVWSTSRVSGRIRARIPRCLDLVLARSCALNEATAIPWALSSSRDTRTLNKIPPRPGARIVPHIGVTRMYRDV
ncbi:hypothetical protein P5V15_013237 [Pogonomyrmex californicus]